MITLQLTNGQQTFLDDVDADLARVNWNAAYQPARQNGGYVAQRMRKDRHTEYLHRVVLGRVLGRELLPTELVDHKDLNPLNNQRYNLRLASAVGNAANRPIPSNNTSGYKGVYPYAGRFRAEIGGRKSRQYLGTFDTAEEAALAYNEAALTKYGEFSRLNEVNS